VCFAVVAEVSHMERGEGAVRHAEKMAAVEEQARRIQDNASLKLAEIV